MLLADVEQLPRLALARTEAAIVESQHVVAGRAEALGIGVEPHLLDAGQPVGQDHGWLRPSALTAIEPTRTREPSRSKGDVLAVHGDLLDVSSWSSRFPLIATVALPRADKFLA